MDVGIYLDGRNPPQWERPWPEHYARTLELVEEAERLGAASVWLSEHHFFEDGYLPQPLTFAAAIAVRTRSIRIGTAVLLAALRTPAHLAEEAAMVDILSSGRLDLGVGLGYRIPEYEGFGRSFDRRFAQTTSAARSTAGSRRRPMRCARSYGCGPRGA
jgi:alkanesulfonate monooxygenase SsuD/methylene tetrahydromethanopterin reductase-like flavin-dependent oxidoreductase (luciferase family)